jgi:hypothetical protein
MAVLANLGYGWEASCFSGGFTQTGCVSTFDSETAVGFKVALPQAISNGNFAKSTMQPSRL